MAKDADKTATTHAQQLLRSKKKINKSEKEKQKKLKML